MPRSPATARDSAACVVAGRTTLARTRPLSPATPHGAQPPDGRVFSQGGVWTPCFEVRCQDPHVVHRYAPRGTFPVGRLRTIAFMACRAVHRFG